MTESSADQIAAADRQVLGIAPAAGPGPDIATRDVVLVTGPWLAGSSSMIAALRERLPDVTFVEADELAVAEAPMAVVFVASAVAPLTESDCALLDLAAANTDLVIGAVSKIDVHPNWRDVLAADIAVVHAHADRYRDVPWVGVAAAAEPSEPNIDELVDMLRHRLADDALARRNRLRAWEVRLRGAVRRCCDDAAAADARLAELHEQRREAVRRRRLAKSDRTVALRSQIEQARVQLSYFARNRCTSVRGELVDDAAAATRQKLPAFEDYVRNRVDDVVTEVNSGVTDHLRDMAAELGLTAPAGAPPPTSPPVPSPALRSGNQETRRIMPLGPRGLRHDRAVLERWVSDVVTELRTTVDALVAERVLAAETTLTAELAVLDEAQAADLAERLAAIDAELRQQGLNAARAAATRNRDLPAFQSALEHVRGELNGS